MTLTGSDAKVRVKDKHYHTLEQVKAHYDIETELAARLHKSTKTERKYLYTAVYDELYTKLPNNSINKRKTDLAAARWVAQQRLQLIQPFLYQDTVFLEIGPGDCSLCFEIARQVKQVYAVDVTEQYKDQENCPENFKLVISDGSSIPVPENSIDVVYSHQVMEHLHPDDAVEQLQNIYRVLAPGGVYICITPNRLSGPHDISHHFDEVATGLHLKEYTVTELNQMFRQAGFSNVSYYKSYRKTHLEFALNLPVLMILKICEVILMQMPYALRRQVASMPLLFRGMTIVGTK